jgi:hypothetical protein
VLGHVAMAAPLSVPPTTVRMRNLLMLGPEWDAAALREQLGEQAAAVEQTVGLDPDAWVPAEAWARLPREAAAQLVLLAAEASERPVLAVDPEIARSAGAERLRQTLAHKVLLVCTSDGHGLDGGVGVTRTIVVSEVGEIVAVGSPEWLSHNLAGEPPSRAEAGAPEADADEEPDEE